MKLFFFAVLLSAAGPATTSFQHQKTGLTVPPALGKAKLLNVQNFEEKHPGAGYGLRFKLAGIDFATFFIYGAENEQVPVDVRSAAVAEEFKQTLSAMQTLQDRGIYTDVQKLAESERSLGDLQSSRDALYAEYAHTMQGTQMVSQTYLAPFQGHFVKLRFTYLKARKQAAEKSIAELLKEIDKLLVDHLVKSQHGKDLSVSIRANPEIEGRSKSAGAAWLGYALSRAKYVGSNQKQYAWIPGLLKPQLAEEVQARKDSIQIWKELKEKDASLKDDYFDTMLTVVKAGLLKEYVWTNHQQRFWKKPAGLKSGRFKKWAAQNLKKHRPETHGYLILE